MPSPHKWRRFVWIWWIIPWSFMPTPYKWRRFVWLSLITRPPFSLSSFVQTDLPSWPQTKGTRLIVMVSLYTNPIAFYKAPAFRDNRLYGLTTLENDILTLLWWMQGQSKLKASTWADIIMLSLIIFFHSECTRIESCHI